MTHLERMLSAAKLCGDVRRQIAPGSRVLKVDAWNEAYWQPYPNGIAGQFADCSVTVVELDEQVIDLAKRRGCDCEIVHAEVRRLPFKDGEFDAVILATSLLGMTAEDTEAAMSELRRVLKPDGVLHQATDVPADMVPMRMRDGSRRQEFPAIAVLLFQQGDGVFDAE